MHFILSRFFYIAFIAPYLPPPPHALKQMGQCGYSSCMEPLSINVAIVFAFRLLGTNLIDMVTPWALYKYNFYVETKGVDPNKLTEAERNYVMAPYHSLLDNVYNYADLMIQYGYMVLFVVALPISPLLSIFWCYVKLKFLVWKQVNVSLTTHSYFSYRTCKLSLQLPNTTLHGLSNLRLWASLMYIPTNFDYCCRLIHHVFHAVICLFTCIFSFPPHSNLTLISFSLHPIFILPYSHFV